MEDSECTNTEVNLLTTNLEYHIMILFGIPSNKSLKKLKLIEKDLTSHTPNT